MQSKSKALIPDQELARKKRRQQIGDIHTTLKVGSKVLFAGGIYGKVVRMGEDEVIGVEIAPKTIIDISRFAIQAIDNGK